MVFHVSSNIPMECLKFGHWLRYCLCWCSLSFDISIRAEVSTLRKVDMTGHKKQPWLCDVPEYCTHKSMNCEFVTIFWYRFYLTQSDIKSTHQVIQNKKVESQLSHISQVLWTRLLFTRCVLSQTHPHLEQPKKKNRVKVKIKRTNQKKKRLDAQVVQLDLM